jgi:hypothetical protein
MTLWLGQSGRLHPLAGRIYLQNDFIRSHAASKIKSHHCVELLFVSSRCLLDRAAQIVNSFFVRIGRGWGQKFAVSTAAIGVRKFCMDFLRFEDRDFKNLMCGKSALGYRTRQDLIAGRKVYVWFSGGMSEGTSYSCTIRVFVNEQDIITSWDGEGSLHGCGGYLERLNGPLGF